MGVGLALLWLTALRCGLVSALLILPFFFLPLLFGSDFCLLGDCDAC